MFNQIVFNNIFNDILEISDREFQRVVWLGRCPTICSSFVEVYCRLYDDDDFSSFVSVDSIAIGFSDDTIQAFKDLIELMERYVELETDAEIIEDPNWIIITEQASVVVQLWRRDDIQNKMKNRLVSPFSSLSGFLSP